MAKKRGPIVVLLLCIVTLGIYFFVWFYKTNEELKTVTGQQFSTILFTLLFLLPLIGLIGVWKLAKHLEDAEKKRGIANARSAIATFLLMAIPFVNIVGLPMTQAEINKVWS